MDPRHECCGDSDEWGQTRKKTSNDPNRTILLPKVCTPVGAAVCLANEDRGTEHQIQAFKELPPQSVRIVASVGRAVMDQ